VTAGADRRPQAVLVWFHWDGKSFLIYAVPGIKVRHVRENPYVELHLNSDEVGGDVIRVSGYATIARSARQDPGYARKYRQAIRDLGLTVDSFVEQYNNQIRVRRLRFH
jgi:PPOX class probable F420-dependent enzyme